MWQLDIGISKVGKYASRDSGDTVEVIERPSGGISVVIADAQGSGSAAKTLSNLVTSKAIALIKEGARDYAVHQAVNGHLYHYKGGKVSCTLTTITVDFRKSLCTVTRNSETPPYLFRDGTLTRSARPSESLGISEDLRPVEDSIPLRPGILAVATTDGVVRAGARFGKPFDLEDRLAYQAEQATDATRLAESLLNCAVEHDRSRPVDDMTVAVVGICANSKRTDQRTMSVYVPLRPGVVCTGEKPNETTGG